MQLRDIALMNRHSEILAGFGENIDLTTHRKNKHEKLTMCVVSIVISDRKGPENRTVTSLRPE